MKTVLIFDTSIDGHHLEYVHHLHEAWGNRNEKLVICVPSKFNEVKGNFSWCKNDKITFCFLDDKLIKDLSECGRLNYAYKASILLRRKCNEVKPDNVFIISLLQFLPILPILFLFRKEKISGIIYKIYLYCWHKYTIFEKIIETIRFYSCVFSPCIDCIYVLNDSPSTRKLNINWNTKKFCCLADPFQDNFNHNKEYDLGLDSTYTIVLHFGGLSERKGTLEILEAINIICKNNMADKYQFVFAGIVHHSIKDDFYKRYNKLKNNINIILLDKFCSYEEINYLCKNADIILAPYQNVYSSSGVVTYAAKYYKPVIVPNDGLLGKIVRRYKLGLVVDELNSLSLAEILMSGILPIVDKEKCNNYIANNSILKFTNTILDRL